MSVRKFSRAYSSKIGDTKLTEQERPALSGFLFLTADSFDVNTRGFRGDGRAFEFETKINRYDAASMHDRDNAKRVIRNSFSLDKRTLVRMQPDEVAKCG